MERIQYLIEHPFEVGIKDIPLIQNELEQHPYFSTLHSLLLFGLKQANHPSYQEELKKSAIYAPSRVALYHYLAKDKVEPSAEKELEEIEDQTVNEYTNNQNIEENSTTKVIESIEKIESKEEPIAEFKNETHSFTEWLSVTKVKSIEDENINERDIKFQLIDDFLEKSPKINSQKEPNPNTIPINLNTNEEYSDLMTETLAQIYTNQKKYEKAIRAYKILSLKYPEKSSFFADRIKDIENLKNTK